MERKTKDTNLVIRRYSKKIDLVKRTEKVIIFVHGIRTNAEWFDKIKHGELWDSEIKIYKVSAGYINILSLITRFKINSRKHIVGNEISNILISNPGCEVTVIAHSLGTSFISEILPSIRYKFKHIFLLASICHSKNLIHLSRCTDKLINDCGHADRYPIIANILRPDKYQYTGVYGFNNTLHAIDRKFQNDHYTCTSESHI